MLLIEAIKDGSTSGFKVLPPLIVHNDDGSYTPETSRDLLWIIRLICMCWSVVTVLTIQAIQRM